jgi:hypothetical protein
MADQRFPTPLEQPLSEATWQTLIHQHSVYAQRRYRYHTRLLAHGYAEFAPSLATFQQITRRAPDRFNATVLASLQHVTAVSHADAAINLWMSFTNQPYTPAHAAEDMASLPDLCAIIMRNASILKSQKKKLANSVSNITPEWQGILIALTVVMEELEIAGQATLPLSNANQELLAPYPDATTWRALLASNPQAATKQFSELLLHQAQASLRVEFNAVESMAIYRAVRDAER